MKFFVCKKCGNLVEVIKDSGAPMVCCGEEMTELIPGSNDGAVEKHVPEFLVEDNTITVSVGSVEHPMLEEHYIEWIAIETVNGSQRAILSPGDMPFAEFTKTDEDVFLAAYAYCNLHGLWKSKMIILGREVNEQTST